MRFISSILFAAAALRVGAQVYDETVYVDTTVPCTDTASATGTVTATITATTCPLCSTHRTTYTTVYPTICETGMQDVTYTVTETCTGPTPSWSQGPSYVPPGFTVTETVCKVCDTKGPSTVTMTVPCDGKCGPPPPPPTGNPPPPPPPPTNSGAGGKATTTTQTVCDGKTTMCPKTSSTTQTITNSHTTTMSRSSMPIYSGNYAATPAANAWQGLALAAVGAVALL